MRLAGLPVAACVFAAMAVAASAESDSDKGLEFRPYFGAAYEQGWLEFKTANLYGKNLSGFAPVVGVTIGKYFAFETSLRMMYGIGGSETLAPVIETTKTDKITSNSTKSYHSSSTAFAFDLLVRYPIGNTGLTPFFLTGLSINKPKEGTQIDTAIIAHPLNLAGSDTSKDVLSNTTTYAVLNGKMETSPEIGFGLAYGYGGAELRLLGRIQNLNMGNSGKYFVTASAGLVIKI